MVSILGLIRSTKSHFQLRMPDDMITVDVKVGIDTDEAADELEQIGIELIEASKKIRDI